MSWLLADSHMIFFFGWRETEWSLSEPTPSITSPVRPSCRTELLEHPTGGLAVRRVLFLAYGRLGTALQRYESLARFLPMRAIAADGSRQQVQSIIQHAAQMLQSLTKTRSPTWYCRLRPTWPASLTVYLQPRKNFEMAAAAGAIAGACVVIHVHVEHGPTSLETPAPPQSFGSPVESNTPDQVSEPCTRSKKAARPQRQATSARGTASGAMATRNRPCTGGITKPQRVSLRRAASSKHAINPVSGRCGTRGEKLVVVAQSAYRDSYVWEDVVKVGRKMEAGGLTKAALKLKDSNGSLLHKVPRSTMETWLKDVRR